jgi:hypothetical protein
MGYGESINIRNEIVDMAEMLWRTEELIQMILRMRMRHIVIQRVSNVGS